MQDVVSLENNIFDVQESIAITGSPKKPVTRIKDGMPVNQNKKRSLSPKQKKKRLASATVTPAAT